MGRLKNGINGPFSGKIGTVVGASCRGVDYVRSKGRKTKKKATPAQKKQRDKFALVMGWLKPLLEIINLGYWLGYGDKTPMNLAMSYHLKEAVTGTAPNFSIDFKKAVFSKGELLVSWVTEILVLANRVIHIKWADLPDQPLSSGNDKATFIVYNPEKAGFVTFEEAAVRGDKEAGLQMPANFANDTVHCWMCYVNAADNKVSTSLYLGQIMVH